MYIQSASSVSLIDSFNGIDVNQDFDLVSATSEIKAPTYKDFIAPNILRRMGKATRMATACSINCLEKAKITTPQSIIVGTGLGALKDTGKFLQNSISASNTLIPPTAFIQSGHNAISGQIALLLSAKGYNMTHVQKGLSFEHALLDASLQLKEGTPNVLVGAVDEKIEFLNTLANHFEFPAINQISEGASFFLVTNQKENSQIEVNDIQTFNHNSLTKALGIFLNQNNLQTEDISNGFFGSSVENLTAIDVEFSTTCYTNICGQYFSSSAFGLHFASEWMRQKSAIGDKTLVINKDTNSFAFILLTRV